MLRLKNNKVRSCCVGSFKVTTQRPYRKIIERKKDIKTDWTNRLVHNITVIITLNAGRRRDKIYLNATYYVGLCGYYFLLTKTRLTNVPCKRTPPCTPVRVLYPWNHTCDNGRQLPVIRVNRRRHCVRNTIIIVRRRVGCRKQNTKKKN